MKNVASLPAVIAAALMLAAGSAAAVPAQIEREMVHPYATEAPADGWRDRIDDIILSELRRGAGVADIRLLLETQYGFLPVSAEGGLSEEQVRELEDAASPSAALFPFDPETGIFAAIFNRHAGGVSRLSIYSSDGGWHVTARHDADVPLFAMMLKRRSDGHLLVTMEIAVGPNGVEGDETVWTVSTAGDLRRELRMEGLLEFTTGTTGDTWSVTYRKELQHLQKPGRPPLSYRFDVVAGEGDIRYETASLTPWLEVLETFYAESARANEHRVARLVARQELLDLLRDGVTVEEADGDLASKSAAAVVRRRDGSVFRADLQGDDNGFWRIVEVVHQ